MVRSHLDQMQNLRSRLLTTRRLQSPGPLKLSRSGVTKKGETMLLESSKLNHSKSNIATAMVFMQ